MEVDKKTVRQLTHEGNVKSASWKKNGNILLPAPLDEDMKKRVKAGEELSAWREVALTGETVDFFTIPAATSSLTETDDGRYVFVTSYDNNRPSLDGLDDEQRRIKLEEYNNSPCVVIDEIPFWTNGGSFNSGKRSRLSVYDKKTDTLTAITSPWFSTIDFDVRGSKVIYKGMEWKNKHIHNTRMGMWLYDLDSGDLQCVLDDDKLRSASFTFRDDKNVLITATDEIPYGVYQYKDFYNLNLETLEITKIAPYDNTTARAAINSDARLGGGRADKMLDGRYYFLTTVGASAYLLYLDRDGTLSHYLTPDGSCDSFDVNGEHILVSGMYGDKLAELYLDGEQVTHFNDEWSATHSISTPEFHKFTNSDGFDVHGWAMKPVGYVEGKKYPAILHIHGGPRTAFGTAFHHEMQLWANEGYFVFYCNPRGGDGRGNEFGNIVGKLGIPDYNDIMEFADCMLERYPDADKDNFGVAGGSYGGFMTNWIICHTDRFKAAVSQRSISSWITMQLVSDIGIWYTRTILMHRCMEILKRCGGILL